MVSKYMYQIQSNKELLISFLDSINLSFDDEIDSCYVIKENDHIIACGCLKDNILKMIGVDNTKQATDLASKIISSLIEECQNKGYKQYYVFTKIEYIEHFKSFGFNELVSFNGIVFMEMGLSTFDEYISNIKLKMDRNKVYDCIVMNCNPITNGHMYLIEKAYHQNNNLIIFLVETNKSFFSFDVRYDLVKQATAHLKDLLIIPSGNYIISSVTFPTYFLKELSQKAEYYANIDLLLFEMMMNKLNLRYRFVGSEPIDKATNMYNVTMSKILKDKLIIIDRLTYNNEVISASYIRRLLEEKRFDLMKELLPKTTYDYLRGHYE